MNPPSNFPQTIASEPKPKMKTKKETPEIHQWTAGGDKVLLVKLLNRDGTTRGGFIWPKSGPVKPDQWSRTPDCDSGGLFGWPWGLHVGDGKDPDACAEWIVFSVKPENVIAIGAKAKAVPSDDGKELPEVIYRGTQAGAMYFTLQGRLAWIQERERGSASATGERNVSAVTGDGENIIEVDTDGIAAARCDRVTWKIRSGAVLIQRWEKGGKSPFKLFNSKTLRLKTGSSIKIQFGKIVNEFSY